MAIEPSDRSGAPTPSVTAVMVTWRRPDDAAETIRSLLRQDPVPRIVVVDNAPELDCTASLADLGADVTTIEIVSLPGNPGFAAGLAEGMRYAAEHHDPDWFWLLDDDSPVRDESLRRALAIAADLPAGAVLANRGAVLRRGKIVKIAGHDLRAAQQVPLVMVDGTLVSRGAAARGGFPRSDMFIMFEDFEYSLRLGRAGVPLFIGPGVRSDPKHTGSEGVSHPWRAYYQSRNHLRAALDARSPLLVFTFVNRLTRQLLTLVATHPPHWRKTLRYRMRGIGDAVRGRLGKRIDPDVEQGHRG